MHSFLKAEWKTIVGICVFCGGIFAWFYHQEVQKAEIAKLGYQYECLRAGKGLLDYQLGTPLSALKNQLSDYSVSQDEVLNVVRYERFDGALALNFRDGLLASIEYYPDKTAPNDHCIADAETWKKKEKNVAETISVDGRSMVIYEGLVLVQQQNDEAAEGESKRKDVGWIVVPI